jgi:hypothetical protein
MEFHNICGGTASYTSSCGAGRRGDGRFDKPHVELEHCDGGNLVQASGIGQRKFLADGS